MSEVKWIKITPDIFNDEKMMIIESLPSSDEIIVIWFKLLCLAGQQNNDGVFLMNNRIAFTDEMLASIFRRELNTVKLALSVFETYGMIDVIDNVITIPNWNKYQSLDAYEKKKLRDKKYQRERREQQKNLIKSSDNRLTTDDTSLLVAVSDKEKDINNNICASEDAPKPKSYTEEPEYQDFLKIYELYPKKRGKQSAYVTYKKWIKGTRTIDGKRYKLDNRQIWMAVDNYVGEKEKSNTQLEYYYNFDTLMNRLLDWVVEESEE